MSPSVTTHGSESDWVDELRMTDRLEQNASVKVHAPEFNTIISHNVWLSTFKWPNSVHEGNSNLTLIKAAFKALRVFGNPKGLERGNLSRTLLDLDGCTNLFKFLLRLGRLFFGNALLDCGRGRLDEFLCFLQSKRPAC